ncbi:MAG: L-seryl-tRNA(Sec) selenium transferase [Planctomycetia bacterium]|nr:MAG: L-seryl-tRNA(Sec) selenium transferase [Planctomycetia bacterium]
MKPSDLLRNIPSVSDLLESPPLKQLVDRVSHHVVVGGVRTFLDDMRREVQKRAEDFSVPPIGELAERIARKILHDEQHLLRPVINATGVILHTGLGRAPLADEAVEQLVANSRDYCSLEFDLVDGERSRRMVAVEQLLTQLTGAEAALVVNNNAAATLLALTALAAGKKVVVSRGQLVEIGGSFRLPDVMSASGALLQEVGTTNKTHAADYERAIDAETAVLMRVHTSNYRVVGFSSQVPIEQIVKIGQQHQLVVVDDIGSGTLVDMNQYGFSDEPQASASIAAGADIVLFSGDKLLGGPQCGVVVGRRELVERMARHAMARALRVGKLTLAALAATLRLYRDPAVAQRSIPLLQLLGTPTANLKSRAERLAPQMAAAATVARAEAIEEVTYLGGGSVPTEQLPTWCVALSPAKLSVSAFARALRRATPAVVGRIRQDQLLLDLRAVFPRQDIELVAAVAGCTPASNPL